MKLPATETALRRPPSPDQLGLAIPLPAARSARAELVDAAKGSGSRKKAQGGRWGSWPPLGEAVLVLVEVEGAEVALEGSFQGFRADPIEGRNVGRVRLAQAQPGLSASLAASLPREVGGVRLGQLRKREGS